MSPSQTEVPAPSSQRPIQSVCPVPSCGETVAPGFGCGRPH
jgi:hypothetical protein